jgi:hypothetical protein
MDYLGAQMSLVCSLLILVVLTIFPIAIIVSYKRKGPQPNNDNLVSNYELDRLGLNICIFFYAVDYCSQVVIVLVVMFLQDSSTVQLLICFIIYSFYLIVYYIYMPYKSDLDDQMAVFNQFSVLAMVYMQYLCTEYVTEPEFKIYVAGNTMMVIFSVNIVVNVVIGFIEFFKPTILKFKRWKYQR